MNRGIFMDVRIQDAFDDRITYYDGTLHEALVQIGVKFKIGKYFVQVKDIVASLDDGYETIVLIVEEIKG